MKRLLAVLLTATLTIASTQIVNLKTNNINQTLVPQIKNVN